MTTCLVVKIDCLSHTTSTHGVPGPQERHQPAAKVSACVRKRSVTCETAAKQARHAAPSSSELFARGLCCLVEDKAGAISNPAGLIRVLILNQSSVELHTGTDVACHQKQVLLPCHTSICRVSASTNKCANVSQTGCRALQQQVPSVA